MSKLEKDPYIVDVDGVQVFSADWVFQQMQAQERRIDRLGCRVAIAAIIAVVSLVFNLMLLLR